VIGRLTASPRFLAGEQRTTCPCPKSISCRNGAQQAAPLQIRLGGAWAKGGFSFCVYCAVQKRPGDERESVRRACVGRWVFV